MKQKLIEAIIPSIVVILALAIALVVAIVFFDWKIIGIDAGIQAVPPTPVQATAFVIVPENDPGYVVVITATPRPQDESVESETDFRATVSKELGVNYYQGEQLDLGQFPAAGEDQIYVAHGDILGTSRCNIIASNHGESPSDLGLSHASWKLWLVEGSEDWIQSEVERLQEGASSHAGTDCTQVFR